MSGDEDVLVVDHEHNEFEVFVFVPSAFDDFSVVFEHGRV